MSGELEEPFGSTGAKCLQDAVKGGAVLLYCLGLSDGDEMACGRNTKEGGGLLLGHYQLAGNRALKFGETMVAWTILPFLTMPTKTVSFVSSGSCRIVPRLSCSFSALMVFIAIL
jgi:hypothetical protein